MANSALKKFHADHFNEFCFTQTIELKLRKSDLPRSNEEKNHGEVDNMMKIETEPIDVFASEDGTRMNAWTLTCEEGKADEEDVLRVTNVRSPTNGPNVVGIDLRLFVSDILVWVESSCIVETMEGTIFTEYGVPSFRSLLSQLGDEEDDFLQLTVTFSHYFDNKCIPSNIRKFEIFGGTTLSRMWKDKQMVDLKVMVDGEITVRYVHKSVLAVHSPVLKRMLLGVAKEADTDVIRITEFSKKAVYCFLKYLYGQEVQKLCENNAKGLLAMAEKFEVGDLKMDCENWLMGEITIHSVCHLLVLADLNRAEKLEKACIDFILDNRVKIVKQDCWKKFMKNNKSTFQKVVEASFGSACG